MRAAILCFVLAGCAGDDSSPSDAGAISCSGLSYETGYRAAAGSRCMVDIRPFDYLEFSLSGAPMPVFIDGYVGPNGQIGGTNTKVSDGIYSVDVVEWKGLRGKAVMLNPNNSDRCEFVVCE